jgi:hypothetical protein
VAGVPHAAVRFLSVTEYQASVRDLFPGVTVSPPTFVKGTAVKGFENRANLLAASPQLVEEQGAFASQVAIAAVARPAAILPCTPTAATEAACGAQFIESFGARAFRRPLSAGEKQRFTALFEGERAMSGFTGAVQVTIEAMLQAPQFLYRIEAGDPAGVQPDRVRLTPFEVATRLSYLLWSSMPDAVLTQAAVSNKLGTPAELEAQARRMLADARAQKMFVDFHRQWLDLDKLNGATKDPKAYPTYTPELAAAMREESDRFVSGVMGKQGDGTLKTFLTSTRTEVDASLAKLYRVATPAAGWAPVDLSPAERAGFLTRGNFLASEAHQLSGSPPLRASFIMTRLLCRSVPPPPANADLTEPVAKPGAGARTNRQLFEERIAPAACNGCHNAFNPFGYALEGFDAIGRYRTSDNGLPVDATARIQLDGADLQIEGGVDLSRKLADSKEVQACVTTAWFEYAAGRDVATGDQCRLAKLSGALADARGDIRELLVALIKSPEFVYRDPIVR